METKTYRKPVGFRFDSETNELLERLSNETGLSKTEILETALEWMVSCGTNPRAERIKESCVDAYRSFSKASGQSVATPKYQPKSKAASTSGKIDGLADDALRDSVAPRKSQASAPKSPAKK